MTKQDHQDNPDYARIKAPSKDAPKSGKPVPKVPRKITPTYLHNAGLYYLQRFASSTGQFRRVMSRKIEKSCRAHPEQTIEECQKLLDIVVESFQRSGLLNDELYATGAIRSLRQRGLSARAIMAKMTIKGVPAELIQKTLSEIDSYTEGDANLIAAVRLSRRRRIGPFLTPGREIDEQSQNRHLAAMARAGFDFPTAQRVLKMGKEEAESLIGSLGS